MARLRRLNKCGSPRMVFTKLNLKKGQTATLTVKFLKETDLTIEPIPVKPEDRNLFGLNKKTERLPGHPHYYKK
jgi:hypothetical protein